MALIDDIKTDPILFYATCTLAFVGFASVASKLTSFFRTLIQAYLLRGIPLTKFGAGTGAYAVVTGASDGIGKEFAEQLAKAKFNVLLVSRTQSKLDAIAQDITSKYGVEAKTYAMDFTLGRDEDFAQLKSIIDSVRVGVLVNNVGTNHDIPVPFAEEEDKVIDDIVEVNIKGLLKMTKLVLPQMRTNRSGLILNLGSFAGLVPSPFLSVYSAGKAFLSTFSQAVGKEVEDEGVVIQNVCTYFVVSAMSKIRRPNFLVPLPKPYVASVLNKIGLPCGASDPYTSASYPSHGLAAWAIGNIFNSRFWIQKNYDIQVDIRKRALRKREREAAAARKDN